MYEWFWANFPETTYAVFRIHSCLYSGQCSVVEVATEHPWLSATALALLSAFMLISAVLIIAALVIAFVVFSLVFTAACSAFGQLMGGGLFRFMTWAFPRER